MRLPLFLGLLVLISNAHSANMQFLRDSVLTELSEKEVKEFKTFIQSKLDTIEDQKVVTWNSKSSQLSGKLKSQFTYFSNGIACRRSLFRFTSETKKEFYQFELCKISGKWQIQASAAQSFKDSDWDILEKSATQTLDNPKTGVPFSWHNPKTGNSGSQVALSRNKTKDGTCRDLAITVFNKSGQSSNGTYTYCKTDTSEWTKKITPMDFSE